MKYKAPQSRRSTRRRRRSTAPRYVWLAETPAENTLSTGTPPEPEMAAAPSPEPASSTPPVEELTVRVEWASETHGEPAERDHSPEAEAGADPAGESLVADVMQAESAPGATGESDVQVAAIADREEAEAGDGNVADAGADPEEAAPEARPSRQERRGWYRIIE